MADIDWNNLIELSGTGLKVAEFTEIRSAIVEMFKDVYGDDIDTSTGTADGIYIQNIALLINNILQKIKDFYSNLDIRTAYGNNLDKLCALTNVYRQSATYSTASVLLTLDSTLKNDVTLNNIALIDKDGIEWDYNGTLVLSPGVSQSIIVTCSNAGSIKAPKGWIYKTLSAQYYIKVEQEVDAIVGENGETDSHLRARQSQTLGANGATVLESLIGDLYQISGVKDVRIYNNETSDSINANDGTVVSPHSIYIIIRQNRNIEIADSLIGEKIFNKLTPGINTIAYNGGEWGTNKSYKITQGIHGEEVGIEETVNWKVVKEEEGSANNTVTFILAPKDNFSDSTLTSVCEAIINHLNQKQLSTEINVYDDIYEVARGTDPLFRGGTTFSIDVSNIEVKDNTNHDTFYYYTEFEFKKEDDGSYTITLS